MYAYLSVDSNYHLKLFNVLWFLQLFLVGRETIAYFKWMKSG